MADHPKESITFLRSLYVAGYPEEYITFLRSLVVTSSKPSLFPVGAGPMSVPIDVEPSFHGTPKMGCSQLLAESSVVKLNADNPIVSGSTNYVPLTVGTVGSVFQRFCLFLVFSDVMASPGPA